MTAVGIGFLLERRRFLLCGLRIDIDIVEMRRRSREGSVEGR